MPSGVNSRYFTASSPSAYLVAMPKNAATSIQKSAPGPPVPIAVATPTMLPVPIVAESAVQSAPNEETSPEVPASVRNMYRKAFLRFMRWQNLSMPVSSMPVRRMVQISGSPQTIESALSTHAVSAASQLLEVSTDFATAPVSAASGSFAMALRAVVTTAFVIATSFRCVLVYYTIFPRANCRGTELPQATCP